MRSLDDIEAWLDAPPAFACAEDDAAATLAIGEEIIENWLTAHDRAPVRTLREGFRLLALHRQAARGEPSFNACRESCRELVYRYNLTLLQGESPVAMRYVLRHLYLFVRGKLECAGLGEFCCSSRPLRTAPAGIPGPV